MTTISMTRSPSPSIRPAAAARSGPAAQRLRKGLARLMHRACAVGAAGVARGDEAITGPVPCQVTYQLPMPHAAVRRFASPLGLRLSCVRGDLWITVDGEPEDHVLAAGESFEPTSTRRVIVYALQPAVLRVQPVTSGARPRSVWQADPD